MNQFSIRYGLIAGVVLALINVVFFFIDPTWLFQAGINSIVGIVTYSFFMIKAIKDTRSSENGLISFGEAFLAGLITFLIASFISTISMFTIVKASPAVQQAELDYTLETTDSMVGMFDKFLDEDEVAKIKEEMESEKEKIIEDFEENGANSGKIGMVLLGWLFNLFMGAILSLILAAIFKKSPSYT